MKTIYIDAPSWLHKYIIGKKGANIKQITQDFTNVRIKFIDGQDRIKVEAPPDEVANVCLTLEETIKDLLNRLTYEEISVDSSYHGRIIGKNGVNIKRIKEDADVQIHFPTDSDSTNIIRIEGSHEEVSMAKKKMLEMVNKMENEVVRELNLEQMFHSAVIGIWRKNIKMIRDMYNQVNIIFPQQGTQSDKVILRGPKPDVDACAQHVMQMLKQVRIDNFVAEVPIYNENHKFIIGKKGANIKKIRDETNTIISLPSEGSDSHIIQIRGRKENVLEAQQMILAIQKKLKRTGYSAEIKANPQLHKFLMGKNEENIKKLREKTGVRIIFPSQNDDDRDTITIIGRKGAVLLARKELSANLAELNKTVETTMSVDPKYRRHFVSHGAEVMRQIDKKFGGVSVIFPRVNSNSSTVTLKGPKISVEGAKQRIQKIVDKLDRMITMECVIPQKHHKTMMRAKGSKIKRLQHEHHVQIKFPEKDKCDEPPYEEVAVNGNCSVESNKPRECDIVLITGQVENCKAAKKVLEDLIPVTEEVEVPCELYHFIIGKKGKTIRGMMETFDVNISIPSQSEESNMIKITGTPASVESAKTALKERIEQLEAEKQ